MGVQKTITLEYQGKTVVSQPFLLRHAIVMDDARLDGRGTASGALDALKAMFEGTEITDDVIDKSLELEAVHTAVLRVLEIYTDELYSAKN